MWCSIDSNVRLLIIGFASLRFWLNKGTQLRILQVDHHLTSSSSISLEANVSSFLFLGDLVSFPRHGVGGANLGDDCATNWPNSVPLRESEPCPVSARSVVDEWLVGVEGKTGKQ